MDFPGVCDRCPLALVCATDNAYEEKNLCRCLDCKRVLMVFREVSKETVKKRIYKAGRRRASMRHIFNILYKDQQGDTLIGVLDDFSCPHPYTGFDYTCPSCKKRREEKSLEAFSYEVRK